MATARYTKGGRITRDTWVATGCKRNRFVGVTMAAQAFRVRARSSSQGGPREPVRHLRPRLFALRAAVGGLWHRLPLDADRRGGDRRAHRADAALRRRVCRAQRRDPDGAGVWPERRNRAAGHTDRRVHRLSDRARRGTASPTGRQVHRPHTGPHRPHGIVAAQGAASWASSSRGLCRYCVASRPTKTTATRLAFPVFVAGTLVGAILYETIWTGLGVYFGDNYQAALGYLDQFGYQYAGPSSSSSSSCILSYTISGRTSPLVASCPTGIGMAPALPLSQRARRLQVTLRRK